LFSFFLIPAAIITSLAFHNIYQLSSLLTAFNVESIFKALANFFANLTLLFLINRLIQNIQTEQLSTKSSKPLEHESGAIHSSSSINSFDASAELKAYLHESNK
jgi:hypothetical protein